MVTTGLLVDTIIKWVIPFLCAGLVSLVTYLLVRPKKIYKKGSEAQALEEWEELARKSNLHKELCGEHLAKLQSDSEAMD